MTIQKDAAATISPPSFGNDMTFCKVITPDHIHLNFSHRPDVLPDKLRYSIRLRIFIIVISFGEVNRIFSS